MMDLSHNITLDIEVVYALPQRQLIVTLQVPQGTTVLEAALLSGLEEQFEGLDIKQCKLGVFARVVDGNQPVEEGDRVEIYRPLLADPREVRMKLAAEGKTMGGRKAKTT